MTNIYSINKKVPQALKEIENTRLSIASDWIAAIDRGIDASEEKSLREWLSLDNQNIEALIEVAILWDKMNDLNRLSDLFPEKQKSSRPTIRWAMGIAATIIMVLSANFILPWSQVPDTAGGLIEQVSNHFTKSIETEVGESSTVQLSDGSELVLNTNTSVEIDYSQAKRIIKLNRGEIHIDVAHDKSRPLSVLVGNKLIQAVGTAFNVQVEKDSIELIVTDGKVIVAPLNDLKAFVQAKVAIPLPPSTIAISKGEKIDLSLEKSRNERITKVEPIEIAASLSWRNGNLIFRGESLADAMQEISRYSNVKITLENNQALRSIRVAGMFKTGDVDGLLSVLEKNFSISYKRTAKDSIFLSLAEQS